MSFILVREVWRLELTPTQQHVLMAMADYADDDGRNCFPSHKRLAWKTGYTTKTIANTINGFIESGLVIVLRLGTNKQPPRYQICLDMGTIKAPLGGKNDEVGGEPDSPQEALGGTTFAPGGERRSTWGERRSPDPIINQSTNQPGKNGIAPFPEKATEKATAETATAETAQSWAQAKEEIGAQHKSMGNWLQGSKLLPPRGMQDGKPLYPVLIVNPGHLEWLRKQAAPAIRWTLSGILGRPVAIEFIAELTQVQGTFQS